MFTTFYVLSQVIGVFIQAFARLCWVVGIIIAAAFIMIVRLCNGKASR